jgi:hypothetical protein
MGTNREQGAGDVLPAFSMVESKWLFLCLACQVFGEGRDEQANTVLILGFVFSFVAGSRAGQGGLAG